MTFTFFTWKVTNFILEAVNLNKNASRIILSLIITITIAILLHELIEKPITKYLKKKIPEKFTQF